MERGVALRATGLSLLVAGVAALVWALLSGEAEVALVLIFPVIYGAGALAALAILAIFAGLVLLSLSFVAPAGQEGRDEGGEGQRQKPAEKREFGGVVLIGPIPIVFGSAKHLRGSRALIVLAALSMIALILYLIILLW